MKMEGELATQYLVSNIICFQYYLDVRSIFSLILKAEFQGKFF